MQTRIIGIDLAVTAKHKAIVLEQSSNRYVSKLLQFHTDPVAIDRVLRAARADAPDELQLVAVLEATGMAWYSVGMYLRRHDVDVYRVNGQKVADLRRVLKRHAKSDRIDARVLARLALTCPESLHRCPFPSAGQMALQRACREAARLTECITASKNRLLATDQFAWLGLSDIIAPYEDAAFGLREHWYNPWQVVEAGEAALTDAWRTASPQQPADCSWISLLIRRAQQVIALYGADDAVPYAHLQASLQREQQRIRTAQADLHTLRLSVVRPLYRQLHPQRHLETLQGVGQDSAAIYVAFIGNILRFPSLRDFRGWSGMIPFSSQSGEAQARGLHITKAGPNLIKATAFLNAEVARLWDPQIAAIYHKQMVVHGKHHTQAVCACATHLLDRIYAILRADRPYQLRDVDGTLLDKRQARLICREQYHVPDEVRRRNNHRARKARKERLVERRYNRRQH